MWCLPELIRIKGEILNTADVSDSQGVSEALYMQAMELARRQAALPFELRAATSLARLKHRQGKATQAKALLLAVYERFTEGFATSDLREARAVRISSSRRDWQTTRPGERHIVRRIVIVAASPGALSTNSSEP